MKKNSAVETFRSAAASLSMEERLSLLNEGFVIPLGIADNKTGVHKWGYRCKQCNTIAIKFVGAMFLDADGNEVAGVPTNVQIHNLPWVYNGSSQNTNRMAPTCPNCGMNIVLDNGIIRRRLVVDLETWTASRSSTQRKPPTSSEEAMVSSSWPNRRSVGDGISKELRTRMENIAEQHGLDSIVVQ